MTDPKRIALASRVRTIEVTSVCWAPSSDARLPFCGGSLTWTDVDGRPCSS